MIDIKLQEKLNNEIKESIVKCQKIGYNPSAFRQMFYNTYNGNGVLLATNLVNKQQTYGFEELAMRNRLDLSIEGIIVKPEFKVLFDEKTLKKARRKLKQCNYELPGSDTQFNILSTKDAVISENNNEIPIIKSASVKPEIIKIKKEEQKEKPIVEFYEGNTKERTILQKERNKEIVKQVKERDNYTCKACGFFYEEKIVEAHHLMPIADEDNEHQVNIEQLITLCPNCHSLAHLLLNVDEKYRNKDLLISKLQKIYAQEILNRIRFDSLQ